MRIEPKLTDARTEPRLNDNGLVLWLNDNGKTNSMWRDYSGKNNHGTIYGATTPPPATPGALGYTFDGVDDYVNCGNNTNLFPSTAVTVSVWVKTSTTSKIILACNRGGSGAYGYDLYISGGTLRCGIDSVNDVPKILVGSKQIIDNIWHHCVLVYDGNFIYGYVDSILDRTPLALTGIIEYGSYDIVVGQRGNSLYFTGSINDVRIYNRPISVKEITAIFNLERGKYGV